MEFRIETHHKNYLIAYELKHTHNITYFETLFNHWAARLEQNNRFGVVLVLETIEHDPDHERDVDYEEAFTKLLNEFRRHHKEQSQHWTVGFVRVFPASWIQEELDKDVNFMTSLQSSTDRMSRYMFGVPGTVCASVEEAQAWLDEQFNIAVMPPVNPTPMPTMRGRVGLFYGSTTGVTETIALKIQAQLRLQGVEISTIVNIGSVQNLSDLLVFNQLILGIPTWNVGQLQDDWQIAFPQLDTLDFTGKQVALFGVGDQYGYSDNYLDAVGILGNKLMERGAELVGFCSTQGYEFSASKALLNGQFMGLALDEVHQAEQSNQRIQQWVEQIIRELTLHPQIHS
jgi:flavodoxin I